MAQRRFSFGGCDSFGEAAKCRFPKLLQQSCLPDVKPTFNWKVNLGAGYKVPVNRRIQLIGGDTRFVGENSQSRRCDWMHTWIPRGVYQVHLAIGYFARIVLQVNIHVAIDRFAKILAISVSAHADNAVDRVTGSVVTIESFESIDDSLIGIHGKDAVAVAIGEQQWSRCDQSGYPAPGPLIGVVQEHTVAVPVDYSIWHVRGQVCHSADRYCDFHSLVRGCDPERRGSASADAGDGDSFRIDIGAMRQIIDRPDAIPTLNGPLVCNREHATTTVPRDKCRDESLRISPSCKVSQHQTNVPVSGQTIFHAIGRPSCCRPAPDPHDHKRKGSWEVAYPDRFSPGDKDSLLRKAEACFGNESSPPCYPSSRSVLVTVAFRGVLSGTGHSPNM